MSINRVFGIDHATNPSLPTGIEQFAEKLGAWQQLLSQNKQPIEAKHTPRKTASCAKN
jgi:hypothetical protein